MAKQNLFTTLLTEAITAGSTSIKVDTGRVQSVNSTLIGEILTIMPLAEIASFTNSEMVKVTGVSGNTLSVTRAQNGTLAKDFAKDSVVVLASTVEDYLIKKNKSILLSCDTAANDSPKVCASSTGSYTPAYGDELIVDFINGCDKDVFTLAVDGMGELLVKIGTENVTTKHISSTTRIQVPMWFDGSFYQIYGSQRNNDTINKLGHGLVASATSSTLSITGGDAIIDGETVLVTSKTLSNTTTAVPTSGVGYIGVNRANQLVVSTTGFQSGVLPVCIIAKNTANQWNPNSLVNYNLTKPGNIDFTTYTTGEQIIGYWTDGRPIYRKFVNFGALPNAVLKSVDHGLPWSSIDFFTGITVAAKSSTEALMFAAGMAANTGFNFYTTSTEARINVSSDRSTFTKTIIIYEYVKTS